MSRRCCRGKEIGVVDWEPETLHCFEFCDLLVSICVLVYIANCALSSHTMVMTQREWDRMAMKPTADVMTAVSTYLENVQSSCWKKFLYKMPTRGVMGDSVALAEAEFKILQMLFQVKFHLPVHFDYVQYIKLVLGDVIVMISNISTFHWFLIMVINAVWWVSIVGLLPVFGYESAVDEAACWPNCDESAGGSQRRQLGGAGPEPCRARLDGDTCTFGGPEDLDSALDALRSNTTGYWAQCEACEASQKTDDLPMHLTRFWCVFYGVVGWVFALMQAGVLAALNARMRKILEFVDPKPYRPENIVDLLEKLQKQVIGTKPVSSNSYTDEDSDQKTIVSTSGELHHRHLVNIQGQADDAEADHIIKFNSEAKQGKGRDANDVMSKKNFETLMFVTQLCQLVIDFYFSFYFVHMRFRVGMAFEDGAENLVPKLLLHAFELSPVLVMFYLLMATTRKISVLYAVLHLDEDAVSFVIEHMEKIKNLRKRIQDTLTSTTVVAGTADPEGAAALLANAEKGELALLTDIQDNPKDYADGRIKTSQMLELRTKHDNGGITITDAHVSSFVDRNAFKAFKLKTNRERATAQTAKTLDVSEDGEPGDDSVELREFCSFVLRFTADAALLATEREGSTEAAGSRQVAAFQEKVAALTNVDEKMLASAQALADAKACFRMTDADGGGTISKQELYSTLRRFKVPMTKKEFAMIFRVIDPDQSGKMDMDEWIDFMMGSDVDLMLDHADAQQTEAQKSAALADQGYVSSLAGGMTGLVLGDAVGQMVTDAVDGAAGAVSGVIPGGSSVSERAGAIDGREQSNPLGQDEV